MTRQWSSALVLLQVEVKIVFLINLFKFYFCFKNLIAHLEFWIGRKDVGGLSSYSIDTLWEVQEIWTVFEISENSDHGLTM